MYVCVGAGTQLGAFTQELVSDLSAADYVRSDHRIGYYRHAH